MVTCKNCINTEECIKQQFCGLAEQADIEKLEDLRQSEAFYSELNNSKDE